MLTYLQTYDPGELVREGRYYRTKTHNSLIIRPDGSWHWNEGGIKSKTALDYLTLVQDMRLPDAVQTLCGWSAPPPRKTTPEKTAPPPPFKLPKPCGCNVNAIAYLQRRGIGSEAIEKCLKEKSVYEGWAWEVWREQGGKRYRKHRSCVFVGYDQAGEARYASMRSVEDGYRRDVTGSRKQFGFALTGTGTSLYVCEAPIDALSRATLDEMDGLDWQSRHYLSLGGTSPLALVQYLTDHPEVNTVHLCQDNDRAGITSMIQAQKAVKEHGFPVTVRIEPPPISTGKDYNDLLTVRRTARQQDNKIRDRSDTR